MANNNTKNSLSRVTQIFIDLDKYRDFCRDYGYRFDEADLYSQRSYVYRQFQKFITGKYVKNQWEVDLVKFKDQAAAPRYRG
jgi:hypothetical protein